MARLLLASLLSLAVPAAAFPLDGPPPQYVLISFDGALDVEQWQRSRDLGRETGASFTYFLSCVYLLTRETRRHYRPPDIEAGASRVGFGYSREDVGERLGHIWAALGEGHEIASHGCGHFDGQDWTAGQWAGEFDQFTDILSRSFEINGIEGEPAGWKGFARDGIDGFRAPYLATGDGLFEALRRAGFAYDASTVSRGPAAPHVEDGLTRFSLPMIPEGPEGRPVIAMDYNLFVRHSGGLERGDEDGAFEERTLAAFRAALDAEMEGDRIPLQIGYHFTLMNGGAYWNALERFATEACARPGVRCISYRDFLEESAGEAVPGDRQM